MGIGGAIITTPAVQILLGAPPIVAVGTPLPVILPTTLAAAQAYRRAGEIDLRAVAWAAPPGAVGAAAGAGLTQVVNPHALLLATAVLIAWQAIRVGTAGVQTGMVGEEPKAISGTALMLTGSAAGLASGLLGIGGGVILVPAFNGILGIPLKRALGTSLVIIAVMVVPGTIVHSLLGHIDWSIFLWLTIGVVPGAIAGSRWTIKARERTVRLAVGALLTAVALAYGTIEALRLARSLG